MNAQATTDSLIVPNLNQITSSTSSSKENDEQQFPSKSIVIRGNSADATTDDQQPSLRKQKHQSFVSFLRFKENLFEFFTNISNYFLIQ